VKLDLDSGIHNFTGIKVNCDNDVSLAKIHLFKFTLFSLKIFCLQDFYFYKYSFFYTGTNEQTVTLAWETYKV